ncbi:TRAP transporter permease [Halorubraceae archaeon YAN]|nr:TRAP transporter permease [Halorubraceae archaeon YAN]
MRTADNTETSSLSTDDELTEEEREQLLQEIEKKRSLRGVAAIVVAVIGITFSLFQVIIAARSTTWQAEIPVLDIQYQVFSLQPLQANAIHVAFALILAFLLFPPTNGTGPIFKRGGALADRLGSRGGDAVKGLLDRIRATIRWFMVDTTNSRITPLDYTLIIATLATPVYMLREFDEIRQMRARGMSLGRPIDEVYPFLDPIVTIFTTLGAPITDVPYAILIGAIGILLVLEATRRALGTFLMGVVAAFIVYARWGYLIPRNVSYIGILSIPQLGWFEIIRDLWFTTVGIFGTPVSVSVRFIYIFILFGAFLEMSGAGKWFIDFAYSLTGSRRGGPAKASVVSSGFMGMLSGSSIANTVTTGAFTIPLMKRSGYSAEFAGGVESSASSGGQILPPVMGAAAFLIVEFTGTPYSDVIVAATVPALAFFFGMWVMVHFEAGRHGIGGLDRSELSRPTDLLRAGWFYLVPIFLLLYYLVGLRLSVGRSGWYTIVAIIALIAFIAAYNDKTRIPLVTAIGVLTSIQAASYVSFGVGVTGVISGATGTELAVTEAIRSAVGDLDMIILVVSLVGLLLTNRGDAPLLDLDDAVDDAATDTATRLGRPSLGTNKAYRFLVFGLKSMESGAKTATTVVIAVAAAGVIPGVISVSGLGPNLTSLILTVSGQSLVIMLLLAGVSAIIMGLGMPTTVMYILLVSMLGGALEQFGVAILAAHLFILYFGLMADVTPPVAVAAYAAAGVAKADEFATGVTAFLLSLNKVMVPFAFIFAPGVLLLRQVDGEWTVIGLSDMLDVGFFIPEVLIPIAGVFAGVWALGVTIIGYYNSEVTGVDRALFSVSSLLLMVPALILLPAETVFSLAGVSVSLHTLTFDLIFRGLGAALLVGLIVRNRDGKKEDQATQEPTGEPIAAE